MASQPIPASRQVAASSRHKPGGVGCSNTVGGRSGTAAVRKTTSRCRLETNGVAVYS